MFDILNSVFNSSFDDTARLGGISRVSHIVNLAVTVVFSIAFSASFVYLVLSFIKLAGGYLDGDPKKADEARYGVVYAILGMLITLMAFVIKRVLVYTLGIAEPT